MTNHNRSISQIKGLISIIVPVYNVEAYLERCINSILNQTYKNFELILVDDGSPDNCPRICDEYAKKDSRIKVLHKENGGLSDARNVALGIAGGEYIMFVDSDDLIVPNCLQLVFDSAEKNDADVVVSTRFKSFDDEIALEPADIIESTVVDSTKALELIFCHNTRWEACGTLYKHNIFQDAKFLKNKLYEDLALIPKVIAKAKNVCFVDAVIYYYFQRVGSIMNNSKTIVKIDLLEICTDLISFMNVKISNQVALNNINAGILMELCSRVDLAERNYEKNRDFILKSRKFLRKNRKFILSSKCYAIKRKIYYLVVSSGFGKSLKFLRSIA